MCRAARHHTNIVIVTITQNLRDLIDRFRQHNHQRQRAMRRQAIALKHAHCIDGIDNAFARHDVAQIGDDLRARCMTDVSGSGMISPLIFSSTTYVAKVHSALFSSSGKSFLPL